MNEMCGADSRLSQRQAAIIGGQTRMSENGEAVRFQAAGDFLKQDTVLETSACQGNRSEAWSILGVAPGEIARHCGN